MPYYLLQATYSPEAWSGMVKNPQNRLDAVRPVIEKLGGKVEVDGSRSASTTSSWSVRCRTTSVQPPSRWQLRRVGL